MFKRKTVLVVGAGASHEYGLPVGNDLKIRIAQTVGSLNDPIPSGRNPSNFFWAVQDANVDVQQYTLAARHMKGGVMHASSIDRYLRVHDKDQYVQKLGKLAIVDRILAAERGSSLMLDTEGQLNLPDISAKVRIQYGGAKPDWLGELFISLQEDVTRDTIAEMFNNLTIVSFNYDRCIEHYIFHALRSFANIGEGQAAEAMTNLTVIHPYGSVGRMPWDLLADQSKPASMFGGEPSARELLLLADEIKTFSEPPPEVALMHERIEEAKQIIFLGFSFLDQNMELLTPFGRTSIDSATGTAFGESEVFRSRARGALVRLVNGRGNEITQGLIRSGLSEITCGQFMRDFALELRD